MKGGCAKTIRTSHRSGRTPVNAVAQQCPARSAIHRIRPGFPRVLSPTTANVATRKSVAPTYLKAMPSKPIELPPRVAQAFVKDMRAFFAAPSSCRMRFAARQLQALNEHRRPRDKPLRLADVKQMFLQMRDHA
jgi:hypothetical protein